MFFLKVVSDIDGTVADLVARACVRISERWQIPFTPEDIKQPSITQAVWEKLGSLPAQLSVIHDLLETWWVDSTWYEDLEPYKDVCDHLLCGQAMESRILFISARPNTEEFHDVTRRWLPTRPAPDDLY